jgi:hypothetical protein
VSKVMLSVYGIMYVILFTDYRRIFGWLFFKIKRELCTFSYSTLYWSIWTLC